MARATMFKGLLVGCLLLAAGVSPARAATVAQVLNFKPDFPDVQITTPAPEEYSSCEVKWLQPAGANASTGVFVLVDAKQQKLRRITMTNGKPNMWSYY